jgi:hypothetical protein
MAVVQMHSNLATPRLPRYRYVFSPDSQTYYVECGIQLAPVRELGRIPS